MRQRAGPLHLERHLFAADGQPVHLRAGPPGWSNDEGPPDAACVTMVNELNRELTQLSPHGWYARAPGRAMPRRLAARLGRPERGGARRHGCCPARAQWSLWRSESGKVVQHRTASGALRGMVQGAHLAG
jgi:hypothetical protein